MVVDGRPVPGGIFDFALYFFHNHKTLQAVGSGCYFYLPKMQSHLEARLWNDVFLDAQVFVTSPPPPPPSLNLPKAERSAVKMISKQRMWS